MMAKHYAAAGAMFVVLCVLLLKSSGTTLPKVIPETSDVFLLILIATSTLAAAWLFARRRRRSIGRRQSCGDSGNRLAGQNRDNSDVPETADSYTTVRWLVRLGAVVSAVVLAALVVGDPLVVVNVVTLAMTATAFLLIVVLVPRGL